MYVLKIKNKFKIGIITHSDDWRVYKSLNQNGYVHQTFDHQNKFVDPTGAHTRLIENVWHYGKQAPQLYCFDN